MHGIRPQEVNETVQLEYAITVEILSDTQCWGQRLEFKPQKGQGALSNNSSFQLKTQKDHVKVICQYSTC